MVDEGAPCGDGTTWGHQGWYDLGPNQEKFRYSISYSRLFGHPEHQFNFFSHQIGGARSKDHEPSFQFRLWTASGTKIGLLCDRLKLV